MQNCLGEKILEEAAVHGVPLLTGHCRSQDLRKPRFLQELGASEGPGAAEAC